MPATDRIVIVGAGLAGLRTAEGLRAAGHRGPITLVGAEAHAPYDRPPLSKAVLAGADEAAVLPLRAAGTWGELAVDLRLDTAATALDGASRKVVLDDGLTLPYDHLVVATGVAAAPLPAALDLPGVHRLRTVDDARAIRAACVPGTRAAVVGAGVLGCELAATLRLCGLAVDVVEPRPGPMWQALNGGVSAEVSGRLRDWHAEHGTVLRTGRVVAGLSGRPGGTTEVVLDDGTVFAADVVVAALGAVPRTEWLDGSGVAVGDGVLCDEYGRALGTAEGVWAVGDVARRPHGDATVRPENWTNAGETARVVAQNIAAGGPLVAHSAPGYFWSDQYGRKLQVLGRPEDADEVRVVDVPGSPWGFLAAYGRSGLLVGAAGAGRPGALLGAARRLLAAGGGVADALTAWAA